MYSIRRIVLESYPILLAAALIGFAAGSMLGANVERIKAMPVILMMVPSVNGLGGNVGLILGARIASALHMGTIEPRLRGQAALRDNVKAALIMNTGVFLFAALMFFGISHALGLGPPAKIALTLFLAGSILLPIAALATIGIAFISFKKGLDPDNVTTPMTTSVIDIAGVACLLIAVYVVGI